MNAVTFNDPFVSLLENTGADRNILQCPLIEWNASRNIIPETEYNFMANNDGSLRLPFPNFRVAGRFEHGRADDFRLLVFSCAVPPSELFPSETLPQHQQFIVAALAEKRGDLVVGCGISPRLKDDYLDCHPWIFRGVGKPEHIEHDSELAKQISSTLRNDLLLVVADFMNPHLYLCKRRPPLPQGKSILWQKAREHYVLLHKSHAANKREAIGKNTIQDGPLIDRAAHSRRAHWRLLRSPKFRHKQGQRICVKYAWIGPKEWTDRSGQIYRIVERSNK